MAEIDKPSTDNNQNNGGINNNTAANNNNNVDTNNSTTAATDDKNDNATKTDTSTDASQGLKNIDVSFEADPPVMGDKMSDLQSKAKNLSRMSEKGLINEQTGSAMVIRDKGQINFTSGLFSQYKLNPNGKSVEQSMESNTITNRKNFYTDDFVINNHKLNPSLYEYTDFKKVNLPMNQEAIVGNFCIYGSVLVKAWEPNLKRYMLIRRPCRMPMFSDLLNVPDINTGIKVSDPLKTKDEILAKSDKGYQVNSKITDAKSLVGKEGINRGGSAGGATTSTAGGGGDMHNASKVEEGYQAFANQRMPNGRNGCVEAAVRIGSYYSNFLKKEYENNVAYVPALVEDAESAGVAVIDFSPSSLSCGDVIVYSDNSGPCHVLIATGNGTEYVGNSTEQEQVVKGADYNSLGMTLSKIIKTSVA